ncbi:reverse transcriptase [Tanacetum coccineum]
MSVCVYPATLLKLEVNDLVPEEIVEVLQDYESVFEVATSLPPKRSHDHTIPLIPNTPPINIRPYRHPPNKNDAVELMVKELLDSGVIRNSQSPFSSPIVMVKKKDGSWRMCMDYRQLNKQTVKDKFPIPVIEELIDELNGAKVFSKLDLRSGYHQIRMKDEDVYKLTFRTHEGHHEFLVMPFGLTNAPSTFQSLTNSVFKGFLRKFVLVFFDDILAYNKNLQEHVHHMKQVLAVMKTHSLYAKLSKFTFVTNSVEYLGHIIYDKGVSIDSSKIQAMQNWPIPQTIKQLRGFLGLTCYYRRFIKNYALISQPLTALLKKNAFQWNEEAHKSFAILKQEMLQAPVLALPDLQKTFVVETDASGKGIGAVLQQDGHPIAYLSKILFPNTRVSRGVELNSMVLTSIAGDLLQQVKDSWTNNLVLQVLIQQLQSKTYVGDKFTWVDGILRRKDKVVVGNVVQLRNNIINHYHFDATGSHSGTTRQKLDMTAYPGYLQPLPIPDKTWSSVSMDFIEGLPSSQGKIVIMVVVDRLSKYAHFIALHHPFTASTIAQVFLDIVYKLHGLPESIISDRDKVFLSHFLQSPFKVLKVQLKLSTAYHPQTEVVNRCLECYLRCMTSEKPKEWIQWLSLAKFWAQDRMRNLANKHRTDRVLDLGMWVYLKLHPHRQVTIRQGHHNKLSSKYYGNSHKMGMLPYCGPNGLLSAEPDAILDRQMKKVNNKVAVYVLVKWSIHTVEDAT